MMKKLFLAGLFLFSFSIYAQSSTEVYLFDITSKKGKTILINQRNISNNEGYDNQPSFSNDSTLLFSSTRNGQTDVVEYDINASNTSWLTNTTDGSEYSPLHVPHSKNISAIRLDTTGLQRLYQYDTQTGKSTPILKDAKVGYHVWHTKDILVHTVLVGNGMDLVISNLNNVTIDTVQSKVGRSLHKIPNSELVSYISVEENGSSLNSLNPITKETKILSKLPKGTADVCWTPNGKLLFASGARLYIVNPKSKEDIEVINLSDYKALGSVSRLAVSPNGKLLAMVAEEPAGKIVQKQVDAYNAANLDAFINCYAEDVVVSYYPAEVWYEGHEKMRENYRGLSPENKTYNVEVLKRITIGNKVIDHEKVTGGGKIQIQVAIYEVSNGTIDTMTFIFDDAAAPDPEAIVQKQLDAYNSRDIRAFLETYSENVEVYNFPLEKRSQGQADMRKGYARYFDTTPDLNCEIKNRMVIGNLVIDEEYITANGSNFSAVAVYEVEKGKIAKVTFLR